VAASVERRMRRWKSNREIAAYATKEYDAILALKAETVYSKTWKKLKENRRPLLQWYPDSPFNVRHGNATKESIKSIAHFDIYYIYARSLVEELKKYNQGEVKYMPFCYDPEMLKKPEIMDKKEADEYSADVVFAGTWEKDREDWLSRIRCPDLAVWGNMWEKSSNERGVKNKWKGNAVYGEEISKLFAVTKIHLNFLREQNRDSNNVRTFEVPGFGGFLLTQRSAEQAQELFAEGREIECFETAEELNDKIAYYLQNDEERLRNAACGHERAEKEHQAKHRLKVIIDDINAIG